MRRTVFSLIRVVILAVILVSTIACRMLFQPLSQERRSIEQATSEPVRVVRVVASFAAIPLVEALQAAYLVQFPNAVFQVKATESRLAQQSLREGQADIGFYIDEFSSPAITSTIITAPRDRPTLIAYDALAVVVAANSKIDALTTAQLRDLYAGRILSWDALGGDGERVEFISRESGSATRSLFETEVMENAQLSTAAIILPSDQAVKDYIISNPGAIGYISRAYVDIRLKVVSIDSKLPQADTIKQGEYALARSLVAALSANASPDAQRLLALAAGDQGCALAAKNYTCPR